MIDTMEINRELRQRLELHLALGQTSPGFHLSNDDLKLICLALLEREERQYD